jgi:hypothetical protein
MIAILGLTGHVSEILFRANSYVDSSSHAEVAQFSDDVLIRGFVRDQVVGVEMTARFGEPGHENGKSLMVLGIDRRRSGCYTHKHRGECSRDPGADYKRKPGGNQSAVV